MKKNIRKTIIHAIVKLIPPHIKPVDYISDTLDIGKESAYRRLRGNMSFSIEELILLSQDLGFSIDELIGLKNDSNRVTVELSNEDDPMETFLKKIKRYRKEVDARLKDENSNTIMGINYLPAIFCVHNKDLFKFSYYAWLHRRNSGMIKQRYADISIPEELESLRSSLDMDARKIKYNTFILDSNVFLSPLKKMRYLHKLNLLSNEDLTILKKAFHQLIDAIERLVRNGNSELGIKYYFYLSDLNIDVNSSYNVSNGQAMSSFNFYFFNRIIIHNPEICEAHKEWLESLKRYSTLITESNEIVQAEYFERQRRYIDSI